MSDASDAASLIPSLLAQTLLLRAYGDGDRARLDRKPADLLLSIPRPPSCTQIIPLRGPRQRTSAPRHV